MSFFVPGLHGEESFHSWDGFGKGLKLGTVRWPAGSVQGSLELYEMSLQAVWDYTEKLLKCDCHSDLLAAQVQVS